MRRIIICIIITIYITQHIYSEEENWDIHGPRELGNAAVHGLIAGGHVLLSNLTMMAFTEFIMKAPWALPTAESIRYNFSNPWRWEIDNDGFKINQFGHPYQGTTYFNAARVNGFSFYESIFFNAFGSFTWEAFGEREPAAISDFITTVTAPMVAGEILYRLYVEAYSAGVPAPLLFFINPMATFHGLVTGYKPPNAGRNIYQFETYLGAGYLHINYSLKNKTKITDINNPYGEAGIKIIYGNPFEQDTFVPFRHFELVASFGTNIYDYLGLRILASGYLFSFSPVYSEKNRMSTGLSLSYDFASIGDLTNQDGVIDHYGNALNWTVNYQHLFSENTNMQIKHHLGFTFFGVSNFYSPYADKKEPQNYGYGISSRRFYILENNKYFRLEINRLNYLMWSYPGTSAIQEGFVSWSFTDVIVSYFINEKITLGVGLLLAREIGDFKDFEDTNKSHKALKMFVGWRI